MSDMLDPETFWSKVARGSPDECWEWQGKRIPAAPRRLPYGRCGKDRAHRVAYRISVGPIPPGMCVCHSCDNPACCNPSHLWLGTHSDNARDRHVKGRDPPMPRGSNFQYGSAHHRTPLTEEQVRAIFVDPRTPAAIARDYPVTRWTIMGIKNGRTWSHITKDLS